MMACNVGTIDRILRVIVGLAIMGAGVYYNSWLGFIGIIPIIVALLGWCPMYQVLGCSTCNCCEKKAEETPAAVKKPKPKAKKK